MNTIRKLGVITLILLIMLPIGYVDDIVYAVGGSSNELHFESNEDYVEIKHIEEYEVEDGMTVTLWANPESFNEKFRTIITKNTRPNGSEFENSEFSLRHERDYGVIDDQTNRVIFEWTIDGERIAIRHQPPEDFNNNWHHYAFSYDTEMLKLYIDGELVGEVEVEGELRQTESSIMIGRVHDASENWRGHIKEVQYWDTGLSAQDIKDNMTEVLTGNEANLVGYWKLNEGEGTVAYDSSSLENNGIIYGSGWNEDDSELTLQADPVHEGNYVSLNWEVSDRSQPYTYQVYQKREGESEYQTVSTSNQNETVRVLNVYPIGNKVDEYISYTTWDGTSRTLPKSASLEMWMESPNDEDEKGYGMGLIDVDNVDLTSFNSESELHLKEEDGSWKYDVVFFGSWDSNGEDNHNGDLSEYSSNLIDEFISSGRGVLFGHDTMTYPSHPNFINLRHHINMTVNRVDFTTRINKVSSSEVEVKKKGFLTNYPWVIGDINDVLQVPFTHSTYQIAKGDVWLNFYDVEGNNDDPSWAGPEMSEPETNLGTSNFYLSTWNNAAMIQTGHSDGEATPDEQKVLANTLFYLSQLTTETRLDDMSGQDVHAPTIPRIRSAEWDNGAAHINLYPSQDIGSSYIYKVVATGSNDGSEVESNEVATKVISDIAGYSYVIDGNEKTLPSGEVNLTGQKITYDGDVSSDKFLHISAVDNQGNISEPAHINLSNYIDKVAPEVSFSHSPDSWTNQNVKINVNATDDSGIKSLKYIGENMIKNGDFSQGEEHWEMNASVGKLLIENGSLFLIDNTLINNKGIQVGAFSDSEVGAQYFAEITARGDGVLNARYAYGKGGTADRTHRQRVISEDVFHTYTFPIVRNASHRDDFLIERIGYGNIEITDVKVYAQKDLSAESSLEVTNNGTYRFIAEDNENNFNTASYTVTNIDKTSPTINIIQDIVENTHKDIVLTVSGSDNESGVKNIKHDGEGKLSNGKLTVTKNDVYTFIVEDNAGNITTKPFTVDNIVRELTLEGPEVQNNIDMKLGANMAKEVDISNLKITDWRDDLNDWTLSLQADRLSSSNNILPTGTLSIKGIDTINKVDGDKSGLLESLDNEAIIDDGIISIINANSERGVYDVSFVDKALKLNLTSDMLKGIYSTKLTWILESTAEIK